MIYWHVLKQTLIHIFRPEYNVSPSTSPLSWVKVSASMMEQIYGHDNHILFILINIICPL